MLNVFLTVDTEVGPLNPRWRQEGLGEDLQRDLYGVTEWGEFGTRYQLDVLDAHDLKAVFFVDPFFAEVAGGEPLQRLVKEIQGRGHEVQLHVHTEWLEWGAPWLLPDRTGKYLHQFSEDEQTQLLAKGLELLRTSGAAQVCAFRAGGYGANFDTLRAVARIGLRYDTSHNACYLDTACRIRTPEPLLQPVRLLDIYEFPITFFSDWPGHYRHAQLCACSAQEMERALTDASDQGWYSFVIVSHSFELLNCRPRRRRVARPRPDRVVIRRFERLCRFLACHRDKFRTAGFAEIDAASIPVVKPTRPLSSGPRHTAWRLVEQLRRVVS